MSTSQIYKLVTSYLDLSSGEIFKLKISFNYIVLFFLLSILRKFDNFNNFYWRGLSENNFKKSISFLYSNFMLLFLVIFFINIIVTYFYSTDTWINFKLLTGFIIFVNSLYVGSSIHKMK